MSSPNDAPPKFTEDGQSFCLDWFNQVLGENENGKVEKMDVKTLSDVGGFFGSIARVTVLKREKTEENSDSKETYIFKQILEDHRPTSISLGCAREAVFYNSALSNSLSDFLPRVFYAHGNFQTGEKYLLLEDLGHGVQAGLLFGPSNPNNWPKQEKNELAPLEEKWFKDGTTLYTVCEKIYDCCAKLHAKNWLSPSLLQSKWLRGSHWWQTNDKTVWEAIMNVAANNWKQNTEKESQPDVWSPTLIELVEASLNKINFEEYQKFTQEPKWTLVHGDFHPANIMWTGEETSPVRFVDWEMIGIGNGPQELGQFVCSHMTPEFRRESWEKLLRGYYKKLIEYGVNAEEYSWENCLNDYIQGGAGRWAWFCAYFATSMPAPLAKFFNEQFVAFCQDHGITAENVPQPRI